MTTSTSSSDRGSSHRSYPPIQNYHSHTHQNQPVIYPYKPDKTDPPGAFLYQDVWVVFKLAIQCFVASCEPKTYTFGLAAGAIKAGYQWAENGPLKKLKSDSEAKDFGGTVHASSIWAQISVLAENILAVAIPVSIKDYFPSSAFKPLDGLNDKQNDLLRRHHDLRSANGYADLFRSGFIGYHGVMTGEEVVNRFARWFDVGKARK